MPLEGNPAAVVDGEGIPEALMQRIALNQHLSETVFLLPPEAKENHARLRIFTPEIEMPFAGHPVVAAAHVLLSEGVVTPVPGEALRLETPAGIIPVEAGFSPDGHRLYTMTQRPPVFRAADVDAAEVASWLGLGPEDVVLVEYVSTGAEWLIAQVASLDAMLRVVPDVMRLQGREISIFCIGAAAPEAAVRVRTFAAGIGMLEDPVTGSSNGCIGALVARDGMLGARDGAIEYVAEQGIEMGQPGRVFVRVSGAPDALSVQVGGEAVTVLRGELLLPDSA